MNKSFRYFALMPFSILYGLIVSIRNFLFDIGLLQSITPVIPVLSVGNLTIGGTGKTPFIEYLIRKLSPTLKIAVLSRGYGRKTRGFLLAEKGSGPLTVGDEIMQIKYKFPEIIATVCEDRILGVEKIMQLFPDIQLILLDDAFQHRRIKPHLSVLLTDYARLHTDDSILPGGYLRENVSGSKRADIIIVSKCPGDLAVNQMQALTKKIRISESQEIFFSGIVYKQPQALFPMLNEKIITFDIIRQKQMQIVLITGIAFPDKLYNMIASYSSAIQHLAFRDHHEFTGQDMREIEKIFCNGLPENRLILTTEKDAVRLIHSKILPDILKKYIFVIPIEVYIFNNNEEKLFNTIIQNVRKN